MPAPCDGAALFALHVGTRLRGPVLCYSQRLDMLRVAQRLGVGRFEANLIIASVLHRAGVRQEIEVPEPAVRRRSWLPPVLTFALVQSLVAAGAWHLLG